MSITNGYCELPELKAHMQETIGDDDTYLEGVVESVSRWIDQHCQRHFWQATDVTRTFIADCSTRVTLGRFNDLVSVTTLKTDEAGDGTFETTWQATDYQLWPLNPSAAPEQRPYTRLDVIASRSFPVPVVGAARPDRVQIVGTFGWPAVPSMVKRACLIQSARVFKRRYSPEGVAGFGEFGAVRIGTRLDPDVAAMLAPYVHPSAAVMVR